MLTRFARDLAHWLAEPKRFWLTLAVLLVATYIALSPPTEEARVRRVGWILEIFGVGTVMWDLRSRRVQFGKPSMVVWAKGWLRRFPSIRSRVVTSAAIGAGGIGSSTAFGRASVLPGKDASLQQRVEFLENALAAAERRIDEVEMELQAEVRNRKAEFAKEKVERQAESERLRVALASAQTAELHTLTMGIVWLSWGLTLSTLPQELINIARFLW